jgi:predicted dehydrogenase
MRFWPGWTWLKETVDAGTYGKVLSAQFRRVAQHPSDRGFYKNGSECGGAILDLHIHDTDFIQYVFGTPKAVTTSGYMKDTDEPDHVNTTYHYDNIPMVIAEGGWSMSPGFGFSMQYCVNFENATAIFDLSKPEPFTVITPSGRVPVTLETGMGYDYEIEYLVKCIKNGKAPSIVTLESAAESVRIIEAERQSMLTGKTVTL